MHPFTSTNNGNNPSFTTTYNLHPFHRPPHHISIEDGTIFNDQLLLLRQDNNLLSYAHNNNNNITNNNVVVHENFSGHDIIRSAYQKKSDKCDNNNSNNNNGGGGPGFHYKPETSTKRKRSVSKTDRHSKIITAQGPRDRRMRLSLDVAKKFFMLQDILGFDKASETVNWLLVSSKSDIQQLLISSHHRSSFPGVSNSRSPSYDELLMTNNNADNEQKANSSSSINLKEKKGQRASRGSVRKSSSHLLRPLAKETRKMARKRARDRTVEKSGKLIVGFASGTVDDDQFSDIRPCSDHLAMNQDDFNRYESWIVNQPENISSGHFQFKQGYIGNNCSSSMTDNWNPSFLINYYQPNGGVLPHEHQLSLLNSDRAKLGM